jgi:hypothetical protein
VTSAQTVSCLYHTTEALVQTQASTCEICSGQVFLRVLLFSAVSIIPPLLHTHVTYL